MNYETAQAMMASVDPHYSLSDEKHALLWKYASQVPWRPDILELGVCHGRTAVMLCYIAREQRGYYCGIDNFSLEGTAASIMTRLETMGRRHIEWDIYDMTTQTAAKTWELPLDFLFIDAGHDPQNVSHDCDKFVPFVKPGGIAAFDDYEDPYNPDSAHWAVRFYADKATEGWERLDWTHGMLIARRPL